MNNDPIPRSEKFRTRSFDEQLQLTRERLSEVELAPHEMLEFARDVLDGAEAWGTGQPVKVGRKIKNPTLFSYDYTGPLGDDAGSAKVFVPSEGGRAMLGETPDAKKDFIGALVTQILKIHQKGQRALEYQTPGVVVASKAGKLSEEKKQQLESAKNGVVDALLVRMSAYEADYAQDSRLDDDTQLVANWVGCDADGAEQIIRDLTTRIIGAFGSASGESQ